MSAHPTKDPQKVVWVFGNGRFFFFTSGFLTLPIAKPLYSKLKGPETDPFGIKACDPVYCSHEDLASEPLFDAEAVWINRFPF